MAKRTKEFVEGVDYYFHNGLIVMTEEYHKKRGFCCGGGCKHCPFEPWSQKGNKNLKTQNKKENVIDAIGTRMKEYYENRFRIMLTRRSNVIIRIDGRCFSNYTKGLNKPYDTGFMEDMNETTKYLCENIQGAKMGYVQSDEISIWLTDYDDVKTDAWFDYNVQKMCSIAASMATAKFNQLRMTRAASTYLIDTNGNPHKSLNLDELNKFKLATFDARCFILPNQDEVINYFQWRQQDATKNSISMAAETMYSSTQLLKKNSSDKQELMFQKGVNWNDYPTRFKRGSSIVREVEMWIKDKGAKNKGKRIDADQAYAAKTAAQLLGMESKHEIYERKNWVIDLETPIFSSDKSFIIKQLGVGTKGNN